MSAIEKHLPADVRFDQPQGELFLWMKLPDRLSADALLTAATEEGVDFVPGNSFYTAGTDGRDRLRLNFVVQPEERIEEGIRRLGKALRALA